MFKEALINPYIIELYPDIKVETRTNPEITVLFVDFYRVFSITFVIVLQK